MTIKKEREYEAMAAARCKILGKALEPGEELVLPTIKPKTAAWAAWRYYFTSHLGFLPYAMQRVEYGLGKGEFTVPCELPEQMDASYTPPAWIPPPPSDDPSRGLSLLQRMAIVQRIQGEISAAKAVEPTAQKPKKFTLFTEEELRALYPPRQPAVDQNRKDDLDDIPV